MSDNRYHAIRHYLATTPVLADFTTQNGWPDDDTLTMSVVEETPGLLTVAVSFEEVIMEGAGCIATRQPCYGQLRLELDAADRVLRAEPW